MYAQEPKVFFANERTFLSWLSFSYANSLGSTPRQKVCTNFLGKPTHRETGSSSAVSRSVCSTLVTVSERSVPACSPSSVR